MRRQWMKLLTFLRFRRAEAELSREIASHLAVLEDKCQRSGMTPEEARFAARRAFGGVEQAKELHRDERSLGWLDDLQRDLRYAARALRRSPGFTLIAVLTLALGIGGTTTVFSVVNGVLIKPLPYPEPEALVGLWHVAPGANIGGDVNLSAAQFLTYREENRVFEEIGLWSSELGTVTGIGEPEEVRRLSMAYGTLQALRVQPVLGRWFTPDEDTAAAPGTVILAHDYWQRRFDGDPAVLGRSMTVDAQPRQIIGVLPKGFRFLDLQADMILPMRFDRRTLTLGQFNFDGFGRLRPGVTLAHANQDVARMNRIWATSWPEPMPGFQKILENIRLTPALRPLKDDVVGDIGTILWVVMGAIGIVFLIATANVANLLLVRVDGRQQELAVRAALGAGRARIARALLVESLVLALAGGTFGLCFAFGALYLLQRAGPDTLPRLADINIDVIVLLFTVSISVISGLIFGLIPVVRYAGPRFALAGGVARTATHNRERHRTRSILVVAEVALSLVLLVSSGLMIRTFLALHAVQPGFTTPEHVQLLRLRIPSAHVREPERVFQIQREIRDRLAAIGGVSAVAFASSVPLDEMQSGGVLFAEDRTYAEGTLPPVRSMKFITPGFFSTIGTPLVAGRDLTWADIDSRRPVAVVSETVARETWQTPALALGKRIRVNSDNPWREIVGVAGDIYDDGVHAKPSPVVYFPVLMENYGQSRVFTQQSVTFAIRSLRTGRDGFLNELRAAVSSVMPDVPLSQVRSLRDLYDRSMARTSFALVTLAVAGGMALLLGLVGIYGVIAYAVAQRTREMGIRAALGAEQGELKRMFVMKGLVLTLTGIGVGLAGALGVTQVLTSLLYGVKPVDPVTYGAGALILMTAAMLASYVPARRAARADPLIALRYE